MVAPVTAWFSNAGYRRIGTSIFMEKRFTQLYAAEKERLPAARRLPVMKDEDSRARRPADDDVR